MRLFLSRVENLLIEILLMSAICGSLPEMTMATVAQQDVRKARTSALHGLGRLQKSLIGTACLRLYQGRDVPLSTELALNRSHKDLQEWHLEIQNERLTLLEPTHALERCGSVAEGHGNVL